MKTQGHCWFRIVLIIYKKKKKWRRRIFNRGKNYEIWQGKSAKVKKLLFLCKIKILNGKDGSKKRDILSIQKTLFAEDGFVPQIRWCLICSGVLLSIHLELGTCRVTACETVFRHSYKKIKEKMSVITHCSNALTVKLTKPPPGLPRTHLLKLNFKIDTNARHYYALWKET